jgi:hypothetical protein
MSELSKLQKHLLAVEKQLADLEQQQQGQQHQGHQEQRDEEAIRVAQELRQPGGGNTRGRCEALARKLVDKDPVSE